MTMEIKTVSVRLTPTQYERSMELAVELYPYKPTRRFNEIVARLLRVAQVVDGKLVADERKTELSSNNE